MSPGKRYNDEQRIREEESDLKDLCNSMGPRDWAASSSCRRHGKRRTFLSLFQVRTMTADKNLVTLPNSQHMYISSKPFKTAVRSQTLSSSQPHGPVSWGLARIGDIPCLSGLAHSCFFFLLVSDTPPRSPIFYLELWLFVLPLSCRSFCTCERSSQERRTSRERERERERRRNCVCVCV